MKGHRGDYAMELRFNEPLCNGVLGKTSEFHGPSKSKLYQKEPRYNETSLRTTKIRVIYPKGQLVS